MNSQLHWSLQRAFYGSLKLEGVFTRQRARLDAASLRERRGGTTRNLLLWTAAVAMATAYFLITALILVWA